VNLNASLLDFEPLARRILGEAAQVDPALHPTRIDLSEFDSAALNPVVNARDALPPQRARRAST
jgi:hypothetical protein